jgi:hypothetical protein
MAQTTPPTVDALPTAPNTSTPTGFSATMDAFLAALITFRTQAVALGSNIYDNCVDAFNNATSAAASAGTASAGAAAAVAAAGVVLWVSGVSVNQNAAVISPADRRTYRRKTATGSGTTDPSLDTTNYVLISNFGYFQSADQTITSGGLLTIAHGLGKTPTIFHAFLKNVTAQADCVTGDITPISPGAFFDGTAVRGVTITADATNILVRYSGSTNVFRILARTSANDVLLTNANWTFFVRALA